ncbi:MAG TPA: protein kinase [Vicinamibacteria bacterium]|nr:protein kinase [Vicinamibacteria bacterium]
MALPARIGRYEVEGLLGQGGMGAVYKARDPELDRTVAIKTVSPILLSSDELRREYLERFRREARAAGRLSHPNIVSVYDLGVDGDTVFFVMEYVPGVSLETILKENPVLPISQAAGIVEQVASGLEEAHRLGIVHRDVKPANVFVDERGRVKLGDFGVARIAGSELTQAGVGLGTPGYSAPEVLRGGPATPRSDVFALGVLAYRLFAGKRPFQGTLPETLTADILEHDPAPPRSIRMEVPEHVSDAVMRALAKSSEQRTPSAAAFVRELREAPVDASPQPAVVAHPSAAPAPLVTPTSEQTRTGTVATVQVPEPPRRRTGRLALAMGLFLGLVAGVVAWKMLRSGDTETARPGATSLRSASPLPRPPVPTERDPPRRPPETAPRPADTTSPPFDAPGAESARPAGKKDKPNEGEKKHHGKQKGRGKGHDRDD